MAEEPTKDKKRRLRQAVTMRERAERSAVQNSKPKRIRTITKRAIAPLRLAGRGVARAGKFRIWKPFRKPVRLIGKLIFPKYFRNSFRELRLVTWPSGKQTRQLTGAVIAFSVIFGLFVAAFDYGLDKLFKQVILK